MKKYGKYETQPVAAATKQPKTKSAFLQTYLTSLLCMVLCVTMFFGTSFAWFTSEVKNVGNEIYIGILDVELEKKVGEDKWESLSAVANGVNTTTLYTNTVRWEPGYTSVETVRVVDKGDLAFNYELFFTDGKIDNKTEEDLYAAAKWFDVWVYNDAENNIPTAKRYAEITAENSGWKKVGTLADALGGKIVFEGKMDEADVVGKETAHTYTIALHMNGEQIEADQEDALNALMGQKMELSVKLVATQRSSEKDSFGDAYDTVFTDVSTSDDLKAAFEEGGNIRLTNDIELDSVLNVGEGEEIYLDMNGKTITAKDAAADPVFYTYKNSKLIIDGNGTVILEDPSMSLLFPGGDVVIENGTFIRNVPEGTPASKVGALIVGAKVSPWGSQTVTINGGYFDGGYYDVNAADIEELLAGTKTLTETEDDIAKRGNAADANVVRVALKNNISKTLNLSYNLFKVYGGTFVGVNPAWGDEGCMLPTTPNYLRPWSYYQGALLDGQTFNENGIVLPDGYNITKGTTDNGRPTYTVEYTK